MEERVTDAGLDARWLVVDRAARSGDLAALERRRGMVERGEHPPTLAKVVQKVLAHRKAAEIAARDLDDWRREGNLKAVRTETLQKWAATHWLLGGGERISSKIWRRRWRASNGTLFSSWRYYLRGETGVRLFGPVLVAGAQIRSPLIPIPALRYWTVSLGIGSPRLLGGKARDLFFFDLPEPPRRVPK